jgi:lysophospholipase L1-like esterase
MKTIAGIFLCAVFSAAFCAGCGGCPERINYLPSDAVILAFGDSITYGEGAAPGESYPSELARLAGYEVINAGVPGELTGDALKRLPGLLEDYRPRLVILCHGGNDMLRNVPPEEIRANLELIVDGIKSSGAEVLLVGVPRPGLIIRTAPIYKDLAKSKRIPSEQKVLAKVLSSPPLKYDQIHPNAEGYKKIAEAIARLLPERTDD